MKEGVPGVKDSKHDLEKTAEHDLTRIPTEEQE
jgi:hypothetical protein